jgi:hypothetical protein
MKVTSVEIFSNVLGDSRISLYKLSNLEEFGLVIQSSNSPKNAIVGKEEIGYDVRQIEEGELTESPVVIEGIQKIQLENLGEILTKLFPK